MLKLTQQIALASIALSSSLTAQGSQRPLTNFPLGSLGSGQRPQVVGHWPAFNACWFDTAAGRSFISHSSDGGVTWSAGQGVATNGTNAVVRQSESGVILAYWEAGEVWTRFSTDGGQTWNPPLGSPGTQISTQTAQVSAQSIRCTIADNEAFVGFIEAATDELHVNQSPLGTHTWIGEEFVSVGVTNDYRMASVSGSPGKIGVAFRESFTGSKLDFFERDTTGSWQPGVVVEALGAGDFDLAATSTAGVIDFHLVYVRPSGPVQPVYYSHGVSTWSTPTALSLNGGNGAHLSTQSTISLTVSQLSQTVHAFVATNSGGLQRLVHKVVPPAGGSTFLDGSITLQNQLVDPVAFGVPDSDVIGVCWNQELSAGPANSLTPLYSLSQDNGGAWFTEPRSLLPTTATATTYQSSAMAASGHSIVSVFADSPTTLAAQILVGWSELAIQPTSTMDDPSVSGYSLPVQSPAAGSTIRFDVELQTCGQTQTLPTIGMLLISAGPEATIPSGACNFLAPVTNTTVFLPSSTFSYTLQIPAGVNLAGFKVNAQPLAVGASCGSSCLGLDVAIGRAVDAIITIL